MRSVYLCFTILVGVLVSVGSVDAADRPNILFIFADDQCYETIGSYGMTDIKTPNLDRLTEQGMTFTHAYNMGSWSGAVCVASRTMLNTLCAQLFARRESSIAFATALNKPVFRSA